MQYKNDSPIKSPLEDLFERKYFAYYLAKGIINLQNKENSYVIGILGKWGEGKTSVINMTLKYLKYLAEDSKQRIEDIDKKIQDKKEELYKKSELNISKYIEKAINIILFFAFYGILLFILNFIINEVIIKAPIDFSIKYFHFLFNYRAIYEFLFAIILFSFLIKKCYVYFKKITLSLIEIFQLLKKRKEENSIQIWFDPWNYTSEKQILKEFFRTISNQINEDSDNDCLIKLTKLLLLYSKLITNVDLSPLASVFENKDIKDIKYKINKCLKDCKKQIIVVIDNIDRLLPKEEMLIFQTVKLLADFPNVVYILSFDKEKVCSDIKNTYNYNGEEYLKKILQLEKTLPVLDDYILENIFIDSIKTIFDDDKNFSEEELRNCYNFAYKNFYIKNIRDLNKFLNNFILVFSAFKEEKLCLIDMISIIMIEIFENDLYLFIQSHKDILCTSAVYISEDGERNYLCTNNHKTEDLNSIAKSILQFKNINVLQMLFPNLFLAIYDGAQRVLNDARNNLNLNIRNLHDLIEQDMIEKYFKIKEY